MTEPAQGEPAAAPIARGGMVGVKRQNPHYVLAALYLICVFSYVDRQLIALVAPEIQRELGLADWQVGFVSGTAFALLYVFAGIPLSRLADTTNRVKMLGACLAVWSVATAACGAASSMIQLSLARLGVAVGEAGGYPASLSMLSDIYPPHRRSTATSIYLSGTTAGGFVSLVAGGAVAAAVGWRWAFVIAGIPGIILLLLLLATVREPVRGQSDPEGAAASPQVDNIRESMRILFARPLYRWVALGLAIGNIEIFSMSAWIPTFVQREFALGPAKAGLGLGIAIGIGSSLVMIGTGRIADALTRRSTVAPIYIAVLGQFLFVGLILWALTFQSFTGFCVVFALAFGFALSGGPMTISATQSIVPANVRGMAAAILVMVSTLSGYGLGPPLIGAISDSLGSGSPAERLQTALAIGTVFNVVYAVLLLYGARVATRALARQAA